MQSSNYNRNITSMADLKRQQHAARLRISAHESALRQRLNQIPGELFYSGVDSVIPSFLSGKVSSFALNTGRGLINHFFIKKAVNVGGLKFLSLVKPSGILRKAQTVVKAIVKRKSK